MISRRVTIGLGIASAAGGGGNFLLREPGWSPIQIEGLDRVGLELTRSLRVLRALTAAIKTERRSPISRMWSRFRKHAHEGRTEKFGEAFVQISWSPPARTRAMRAFGEFK